MIETVSQQELRLAGQIILDREEDSVMSLAIGGRKGKTTYAFAGVNSSPASIEKGKNEHLRVFGIEQSKSRASSDIKLPDTNISQISRTSLFADPEPEMYQRLLRIAGSVGVCATGLSKSKQLAVFDVAGSTIKPKGIIDLAQEAEDLDILQTGDKEWQVAFCSKYDLHVLNLSPDGNEEPRRVFTIAADEPEKVAFRAVRFVSSKFLIAVANMPKRSGFVLYGFRLPEKEGERARIAVSVRTSKKISATAFALANLSPPTSPGGAVGDTQFMVAVAGSDSSVSLYTVEHRVGSSIHVLKDLYPLQILQEVHGADNITGLAFSTFVTPKTHIRPQFIKLASSSLGQTVSVLNIPLKKYVDKTPRNRNSPPRAVRYVSAIKSKAPSNRALVIALSVMVLILAIIGQGIREMYGGAQPIVHAQKFLPSWHGTLRSPEHPPAAFLAEEFVSKLLGDKQPQAGETLVIREADVAPTDVEVDSEPPSNSIEAVRDIQLDVHDPSIHGPGKTWEELGEEQKEAWKARLMEAGAWTQSMGESVFKGILFGELAGAVGRAVGN